MAVFVGDKPTFYFLWNNFTGLWNDTNLVDLLRFLVEQRVEFIEDFIQSKTSQKIFLNSTQSVRDEIISIVRSNLVLGDSVKNILNN